MDCRSRIRQHSGGSLNGIPGNRYLAGGLGGVGLPWWIDKPGYRRLVVALVLAVLVVHGYPLTA